MKSIYLYTMFAGFLASSAANAHVRFEHEEAPAGAYSVAGLLVPHGCDDKATTSITVKIAEGVTQVTPRAVAGWQVSIQMRTLEKPILIRGFEVNETVDSVTWSGGNLPSFAYERFDMHMKMPSVAGSALYFPTTQVCGTEEIHWANLPKEGEEYAPEPAPVIKLKE